MEKQSTVLSTYVHAIFLPKVIKCTNACLIYSWKHQRCFFEMWYILIFVVKLLRFLEIRLHFVMLYLNNITYFLFMCFVVLRSPPSASWFKTSVYQSDISPSQKVSILCWYNDILVSCRHCSDPCETLLTHSLLFTDFTVLKYWLYTNYLLNVLLSSCDANTGIYCHWRIRYRKRMISLVFILHINAVV